MQTLKIRFVALSEDKCLTKKERQAKVDRRLEGLKKKPSRFAKLKRFWNDPIVWPKYNELL